ncbi:MAG: DUF3134 domain-containing protein [Prochloraceae cyanobacterium]|nr:DUF3134 domain-containing protein [Prochloraceae cyanobacterium]
MENPALRQEPRYEPAVVIPIKQEYSLLEWLESKNRLIAREVIEKEAASNSEEEVSDLLMSDDSYEEEEEEDDISDIAE